MTVLYIYILYHILVLNNDSMCMYLVHSIAQHNYTTFRGNYLVRDCVQLRRNDQSAKGKFTKNKDTRTLIFSQAVLL